MTARSALFRLPPRVSLSGRGAIRVSLSRKLNDDIPSRVVHNMSKKRRDGDWIEPRPERPTKRVSFEVPTELDNGWAVAGVTLLALGGACLFISALK